MYPPVANTDAEDPPISSFRSLFSMLQSENPPPCGISRYPTPPRCPPPSSPLHSAPLLTPSASSQPPSALLPLQPVTPRPPPEAPSPVKWDHSAPSGLLLSRGRDRALRHPTLLLVTPNKCFDLSRKSCGETHQATCLWCTGDLSVTTLKPEYL